MTRRAQPLELALVQREAFRLAVDCIGVESEPGEVMADCLVMFGGRALGVGIVDAQQEAALMP